MAAEAMGMQVYKAGRQEATYGNHLGARKSLPDLAERLSYGDRGDHAVIDGDGGRGHTAAGKEDGACR
jgi:hypothetical protein